MLTARGEADRIVGLELGADDYVTKPFSPRELAAHVGTVLRSQLDRLPPPGSPLRRPRARRETREVRKAAGRSLTTKEFDLLWFLASHPRQVFSRDQLMDRVWGYAAALDTGTVTVHVRRMREKIEDDPASPATSRRSGASATCLARMIAFAVVVARRRSPQGSSRPPPLTRLPECPPAARRARAVSRSFLPLAAVALSGVVMFAPATTTILFVAVASSTAALASALLLARSIVGSIERVRSASSVSPGGSLCAGPEKGPAELAELASSFNEMAGSLRGLFDARQPARAWASHDLRDAARLDAGDDRGARGRPRRARYLPAMREQVRTLGPRRRSLRARADRAGALTLELPRRRSRPRRVPAGVEAEAAARQLASRRVVDGRRPVAAPPTRSSACSTTCSRTRSPRRPTDRSPCWSSPQEEVRVTVEDTGEGIPKEPEPRVFDRSGAPTRRARARGGAGLGLAIARGLVEAQGREDLGRAATRRGRPDLVHAAGGVAWLGLKSRLDPVEQRLDYPPGVVTNPAGGSDGAACLTGSRSRRGCG